MIVFITRTSEPNQDVSPFPGAKRHACVVTMPNGDRAWVVELYDAPRERVTL